MEIKMTVSAISTSGTPAPADAEFTICSASPSFRLEKLSYDPFPPPIKKPLTVIIKGSLTQTIQQGAVVNVVLYLGSMQVATQNIDLCEALAEAGLSCPVAPQDYTFTFTVPLPPKVPPFVTIVAHVEGWNADGSWLTCFDAKVKFVP